MTHLTIPLHGLSTAPSRLLRLPTLLAALVREVRLRQARRRMEALDDAMLSDIGVSRAGIEDAVRHGTRG